MKQQMKRLQIFYNVLMGLVLTYLLVRVIQELILGSDCWSSLTIYFLLNLSLAIWVNKMFIR